MNSKLLFIMPILLSSGLVLAEEPMSVEDALSYELPENNCVPPEFVEDGTSSTAPVQDPSGVPYFQGSSTANISDTDYYERERQGRRESRWKKCLADYKEGLLQDMERLKSSAQHGLTEAQAHEIVGHMRLIQDTYLSPNGEPPAPGEVAEN